MPKRPRMSTPHTLLPRGVYRAPWLYLNGETVYIAVDSRGRFASVMFADGNDLEVMDRLRELLDLRDPITLRLVS